MLLIAGVDPRPVTRRRSLSGARVLLPLPPRRPRGRGLSARVDPPADGFASSPRSSPSSSSVVSPVVAVVVTDEFWRSRPRSPPSSVGTSRTVELTEPGVIRRSPAFHPHDGQDATAWQLHALRLRAALRRAVFFFFSAMGKSLLPARAEILRTAAQFASRPGPGGHDDVMRAQDERAPDAVAPMMTKEEVRAPAVAEARVLQRRELIEAADDERDLLIL